MDKLTAAGWSKLQAISIAHACSLHHNAYGVRGPRRNYRVPEVIQENVEILGRGSETEIKLRIMWYATFYPSFLNAKAWS